jgi:hypothetical protein
MLTLQQPVDQGLIILASRGSLDPRWMQKTLVVRGFGNPLEAKNGECNENDKALACCWCGIVIPCKHVTMHLLICIQTLVKGSANLWFAHLRKDD